MLGLLSILGAVVACDDGPTTPNRAAGTCAAATDCASCLAADCNWTGGECLDECLQDVDCYGPGNPHAPACPVIETCAAATDCASCLAADCNWTGGECLDECLQDVDCYGPGNPHAPACPAAP